jgi:F0F1-type ATP synthase, beta subunit
MANEGNGQVGTVVQIIGPVVDVEFSDNYLPPIYQALRISSEGFDVETKIDVVAEVQQHLGEGRVRCIDAADGWYGSRHEGVRSWRSDHRSGRRCDIGTCNERHRRSG